MNYGTAVLICLAIWFVAVFLNAWAQAKRIQYIPVAPVIPNFEDFRLYYAKEIARQMGLQQSFIQQVMNRPSLPTEDKKYCWRKEA